MTYGKTVGEAEADLRIASAGLAGLVDGLVQMDLLSEPTRELAERIVFDYNQARFALKHAERVAANKALHVPYAEFCHHPEKCAGLGSCPRDPICCD